MAEQYPWYGVANGEQSIAQGYFVRQCLINSPCISNFGSFPYIRQQFAL